MEFNHNWLSKARLEGKISLFTLSLTRFSLLLWSRHFLLARGGSAEMSSAAASAAAVSKQSSLPSQLYACSSSPLTSKIPIPREPPSRIRSLPRRWMTTRRTTFSTVSLPFEVPLSGHTELYTPQYSPVHTYLTLVHRREHRDRGLPPRGRRRGGGLGGRG